MRPIVDQGLCQGYANCVLAAPDVFDLDDESGLAHVIDEHPSEDRRQAVEEAVRTCPTNAISVADD